MQSIKTARILLIVTLILVMLSSLVLKNRVQVLERELASINNNIDADIKDIHILKAQWSKENSPDRLRKMANQQLSLDKAKPQQLINYSALQFIYEEKNIANKSTGINKKGLTTLVKAELKRK